MKLSVAIRMGSVWGRQLHKALLDGEGGSCALGAAMIAVGIDSMRDTLMHSARLGEHFPILGRQVMIINIVDVGLRTALPIPSLCKDYGPMRQHLRSWIELLNDRYGLSREQIADFVEEVEKLDEEFPLPQLQLQRRLQWEQIVSKLKKETEQFERELNVPIVEVAEEEWVALNAEAVGNEQLA